MSSPNVTDALFRIKERIKASIEANGEIDADTSSDDYSRKLGYLRGMRDVLSIIKDEERNQILIDDDAEALESHAKAMDHVVNRFTEKAYDALRRVQDDQ